MKVSLPIAQLAESLRVALLRVPQLSASNAAIACMAIWAFIKLVHMSRRRCRTPRLRGPPSPSFTFGVGKLLLEAQDPAAMYELWAQQYGPVYETAGMLGTRKIVLYDPKAIAHFFSLDGWVYGRSDLGKMVIERTFGRGLAWAEGESHRRQRKTLTPAFSIAAIWNLTPIFYDSAHKASGAWSTLIEGSGGASSIIDVQHWMNYISLNTMGLAGFSHDFGALQGRRPLIASIFDTFTSSPSVSVVCVGLGLLMQVFPILSWMPTPRTKLVDKMNEVMEEMSNDLRTRTKKEMKMSMVGEAEKSIIGQLIKSEASNSELYLSEQEMKVLLLAGYETTAVSLTWALIELSRNLEVQATLRKELLKHASDPTYDQLTNSLPYLDAVVHEVLRIHAPVPETVRIALEDDVLPLSQPIHTKSGELIQNLPVVKGTHISVPMLSVNRSDGLWGQGAKDFKPSRWLEDDRGQNSIPAKVNEVQGHRHLLTFLDGPRTCLGRNFAVTEFKGVLSVLVRNFMFEFPGGLETRIETGRGILPRPCVAGEVGCRVPLLVKPYSE